MSFSSDAKAELCRVALSRGCCAAAELYGALLYCNTFTDREIKLITGSAAFAARLPKLLSRAAGVGFDSSPDGGTSGKSVFKLTSPEKIAAVFSVCGYEPGRMLAHHVNLNVLEEECCRVSFIRGAFLAGGSMTDPAKRYHLELVTDHFNVSGEVFSILLDMGFSPKSTLRGGNYVTYFKQSEAIEDLLTTMGAPVAAMELMSAKVEKDIRNSVNRRVNCEAANVGKTAFAAMDQIEAIRELERTGKIENLPAKLRETARLRADNPELSLSELCAMCSPPVSKSCLNHRLRKLMDMVR